MKYKEGRQSGNIDDRRGIRRYVFETNSTRADRQFNRVREDRFQKALKKNPSDGRAAAQRATPEQSDMPQRTRNSVEQIVARLNSQPTEPAQDPNPRRPNSRPRRIPGTGR